MKYTKLTNRYSFVNTYISSALQHVLVINWYILPSSVFPAYYLALVMLCRSLSVCSERSEGTRISTGLILRTRHSSSEREGPSGKQSRSTSPVLGWTACRHKHMLWIRWCQRCAARLQVDSYTLYKLKNGKACSNFIKVTFCLKWAINQDLISLQFLLHYKWVCGVITLISKKLNSEH